MKTIKRVLMSALIAVVAVGFICVPGGVSFAAEDDPALVSDSFWVNDPTAGLSFTGIKSDTGPYYLDVKSSDTSVISVAVVNNSTDDNDCDVKALKPGQATITVTFKDGKSGDKEYTSSAVYTVKKYPNAIKKLKINGKTVKVNVNKNAYSKTNKKYKKKYAKVKVTPKKGWKVVYVSNSLTDYKDRYKYKELKAKVVTKGKKISFPKKYKEQAVIIILKNKKTKDMFYYQITNMR